MTRVGRGFISAQNFLRSVSSAVYAIVDAYNDESAAKERGNEEETYHSGLCASQVVIATMSLLAILKDFTQSARGGGDLDPMRWLKVVIGGVNRAVHGEQQALGEAKENEDIELISSHALHSLGTNSSVNRESSVKA